MAGGETAREEPQVYINYSRTHLGKTKTEQTTSTCFVFARGHATGSPERKFNGKVIPHPKLALRACVRRL
jgi:hypothetical protein